MKPFRFSLVAALALSPGASILSADPRLAPRPELEITYETLSRTPKVAGVLPLVPSLEQISAGPIPPYYRRLAFSGERHIATAPLLIRGTTSQEVSQKREKLDGTIRHVYNPVTDAIDLINTATVERGMMPTPAWGYLDQIWPVPPALTGEVPLTESSPLSYGEAHGSLNNPIGLLIRDATHAGDDNQFIGSVGGITATAASEIQFNWQMELSDEEESTERIEARAKVFKATNLTELNGRSTLREIRKPLSRQWTIREVVVSYRLRTSCPGDYILTKTFRRRPVGAPGGSPWLSTWTETEVIHIESSDDLVRKFEIPLRDDAEVQLAELGIQHLASGCGPVACAGGSSIAGGVHGPISGSIYWLIPLGAMGDGRSAGGIILHRPNITPDIYTPAALVPTAAGGSVFRDAQDSLRQILLPQALVDVVALSAQAYEIRFYERGQAGPVNSAGLHVPEGIPYLKWKVENPDPSGSNSNRLRVTRLIGSESLITEVDESQPGRRLFSEAGGLRVTETTASVWTGTRVETHVVRDATGQVASKRTVHYAAFPWGDEQVKEILDPDGAALTTEWTYGTTLGQPDYRQVLSVKRPDGFTETTAFANERSFSRYTPIWADATQRAERSVELVDLNSDGMPDRLTTLTTSMFLSRLRVEWLIDWGIPAVGAMFQTRDRYVGITGATAWNSPGNIRTRERYALETGEFLYRLAPDGTLTLRSSAIESGSGNTIMIEEQGASDATHEMVIDGTRSRTVTSPRGQWVSTTVNDIASGRTIQSLTVAETDALGRAKKISHLDGAVETRDYCDTCAQVISTTFRGDTTDFSYDARGRKTEEIRRAGGTLLSRTRFRYDAEDRLRQTLRVDLQTGAETVVAATSYDLAGRVVAEFSLQDGAITHTHAFGPNQQTITTTTYADGGTRIETRGPSGAVISVRGSAVSPVDYTFNTRETDGRGEGFLRTTHKRNDDGSAATEQFSINLLGEVEYTLLPGNVAARRYFDSAGRVAREVDPDGVTVLYGYDGRGRLAITAVDMNRNGIIDYAGSDRISRTLFEVAARNGVTVQREVSQVWEVEGQDTPATIAVSEVSVDGACSWQTVRGLTTTMARMDDGAGGHTVTSTAPDGVVTIQSYLGDRLISVSTKDSAAAPLTMATFGFDGAGRMTSSTDARAGTTTFSYDGRDRLQSMVTSDPDENRAGTGYDPQSTSYTYDQAGRPLTVTQPDGGVITASYYPTGLLKRVSGARTHPIEYVYDSQGRVKTMTTWQDFAGDAGRAVTTWEYDAERGWLLRKRYENQPGPAFSHTPAGRLRTRTWARGVSANYLYSPAGDLSAIDYSDATPDAAFSHDRLGRIRNVSDASGSRILDYHESGQLRAETYVAGLLNQATVTRTFDALHRLGNMVFSFGVPVSSSSYTYDAASRLSTATSGNTVAAYTYAPNSTLIARLTQSNNGVERLTSSRVHDRHGRLASVSHALNAQAVAVSHVYTYDAVNQRTRATQADDSYWSYAYDALGQVTGDHKFLGNGTPAIGRSFAHAYDDTGNRRTSTTNGMTTTFAANSLNQYAQRSVPPAIEVLGAAVADAQVLVSDGRSAQIAQRQGETYFAQLPVANVDAAQSVPLQVAAVGNQGTGTMVASAIRPTLVPKSPEVLTYDSDGNPASDARWLYSWDAENRLAGMTARVEAIRGERRARRVDYVYDAQGRRVEKRVTRAGAIGVALRATYFDLSLLEGGALLEEEFAALDFVRPAGWHPTRSAQLRGYSVQWNGTLQVPASGAWTLKLEESAGRGYRLYFDQQLVFDRWSPVSDGTHQSVSLSLTAGRDYALRVDFSDGGGGGTGVVRLLWAGPGVAEQLIPAAWSTQPGPYDSQEGTRFLYDGWNLLAEIGANGVPQRTYAWGLDVSGSVHGAAGVGGLLSVTDAGSAITYFAASDGNGNVVGLFKAADGTVAAHYDYTAFGEVVRREGPAAELNPFRFSTKFADAESGRLYFGYRYYDSTAGRWLNRDPIGEEGGANLYAYVDNSPAGEIDPLGLAGYFFDGTGNNAKSGTNVRILWEVYDGSQRFYYPGVGSSFGARIVGGLTGAGGGNRLESAYRDFIRAVDTGDRYVDIVGFSRGAALAREFANLLVERGYDPSYGGKLKNSKKVVQTQFPGECEIAIRFVGLFDTVGSFGIPGNHVNLGIRMNIAPQVLNAVQATAHDEKRHLFPLTPLGTPSQGQILLEQSFIGDHSDIGRGHGANTNDLSRAPLEFIWRAGRAAGTPFGNLPTFTSTGSTTPHDLSRKFPHNLFPKRPR